MVWGMKKLAYGFLKKQRSKHSDKRVNKQNSDYSQENKYILLTFFSHNRTIIFTMKRRQNKYQEQYWEKMHDKVEKFSYDAFRRTKFITVVLLHMRRNEGCWEFLI